MSSSTNGLPVGVIGCGRMGRLHARVLAQMPAVELIGVVDANAAAAEDAAKLYGCQAFTDPLALLPRVKAITIAVPTQFHVRSAEPFLRAGIPCLIEKPLAKDVDECRRIVELAKANNVIVQVGHIERFNPAVRALFNLNLKPTFIEVVRVSPMTFRSIDVGVVLDMMIHDLDIVLKLADSPVVRVEAVGGSVVGTVEDVCNARVTFASGCVANVTASRLAAGSERRLRVFSGNGFASVDYATKRGAIIRRGERLDLIREAIAKVRAGESVDLSGLKPEDLMKVEPLKVDDQDQLRAEQESFIEAVRTGSRPLVTAEDGAAAVELATQIVQAIQPQTL